MARGMAFWQLKITEHCALWPVPQRGLAGSPFRDGPTKATAHECLLSFGRLRIFRLTGAAPDTGGIQQGL